MSKFTPDQEVAISELEAKLNVHGEKYTGWSLMDEQGTLRHSFLAGWGPRGNLPRVVLIDKEADNEMGDYWIKRGNDTENDASMMALMIDPDKYGVVQMIDWGQTDSGRNFVVTKHYPSKSLEHHIQGGYLNQLDERVYEIFDQLLTRTVEPVYRELGLVHRDLKPGNILIGTEGVKVADWQTAATIDELVDVSLPSGGGRAILYAPNFECFAGVKGKYDVRSVINEFCVTLFKTFKGRYAWKYNPLQQTGIRINPDGSEGESLLDDNGRLSTKHNEIVREELRDIPEWAREIIYKGCSFPIDGNETYESMEGFLADWKAIDTSIFEPEVPFKERALGFMKKPATLALVAGLAIGALGLYTLVATKSLSEQAAFFSTNFGKHEITTWHNTEGGIENSIVDMSFDSKLIYTIEGEGVLFPTERDFFHVAEGEDRLQVGLFLRTKDEFKSAYNGFIPQLPGRVYIEGFEPTNVRFSGISVTDYDSSTDGTFTAWPKSNSDTEIQYDLWMIGAGMTYIDFQLPPLEPGVYSAAFEVYSPTWKEALQSGDPENLELVIPSKSMIIARKTVDLIVGDGVPLTVSGVRDGPYSYRMILENPFSSSLTAEEIINGEGDLFDDGVQYSANLLDSEGNRMVLHSPPKYLGLQQIEMGEEHKLIEPFSGEDTLYRTHAVDLRLPNGVNVIPPRGNYILELLGKKDGGLVFTNWMPIKYDCNLCSGPRPYMSWQRDTPRTRELWKPLKHRRDFLVGQTESNIVDLQPGTHR